MLPDDLPFVRAVAPAVLLEKNLANGRCVQYRKAKTVTCYADFSHLYDDVRKVDYAAVRQEVQDYLGGRTAYYRYSNATYRCYLTPDKVADIAAIFARHGFTAIPHHDMAAVTRRTYSNNGCFTA